MQFTAPHSLTNPPSNPLTNPPSNPPIQQLVKPFQTLLEMLEKKSEKQPDTVAGPVVAVVAPKSTGTQVRAKERVKEEKAIESADKLFLVFHH